MATPKEPRPYIDPYLAGALLGVVLFLSFFVTGGGLGASAALSRVQTGDPGRARRRPTSTASPTSPSWRAGRGAPGSTTASTCSPARSLGGLASGLWNRRVKLETRKGPRISTGMRWAFAFAGGVIMAYGARLARGCTSGQALSGGAVLSVGSWAFMFSIFAAGYAVAWFFRRLWI